MSTRARLPAWRALVHTCVRSLEGPLQQRRFRAREPVVLHTRVVTETGGGPEKTILNSPRFMETAGYRTVCAYMHPVGDPKFEQLVKKAEKLRAPLIPVDDRGPFDCRVVFELLEICRREHVEIWHAHDYKSNVIGLLLRPFWRMHLVTTVHGWVKFAPPRTTIYYALDRWCLPHYEKVICVSQDLYNLCTRYGIPPERCLLIENAIDTEDYRRRSTQLEAKKTLGMPPERFLIGAVGRLSKEKGFDILIRAVNLLLKKGSAVECIIVGEGDQKDRLQALISELGCGDHVHLSGYVPEPKQCYEAMDVYALSSSAEGLPNVLLEAMALEVPIVATRVAGVPSLIRHEEIGLLVEPGSPEALAGSVERLMADTALRKRFQQAGRRKVETTHSFELRMRKVRAVYDELLGRAGSAAVSRA